MESKTGRGALGCGEKREGKKSRFFLFTRERALFLFHLRFFHLSFSLPVIFILYRQGERRGTSAASLSSRTVDSPLSRVLSKRERSFSFSTHLSALFQNPIFGNSLSRAHRREHVLLELPHHVSGLEVVAHVDVGTPIKVGAELGVAPEAARGLPEHLRSVARLAFFCRFLGDVFFVGTAERGACETRERKKGLRRRGGRSRERDGEREKKECKEKS